MGTCCDALTSIDFSFDLCNIYRDCPRGVPRGNKMWLKTLIRSRVMLKTSHSPPIYRYISEMVEDRSVHAARRLTNIEFSFDPCNIYRDGPRGVGYPADAGSVGDSHPSCRYRLDICTSVRPSITRWYCIKMAEYIVMLSSPHDSPFILVFMYIKQDFREIPTGSAPGGAKQR